MACPRLRPGSAFFGRAVAWSRQKRRDCLFPSKTGSAPCACLRRPPLIDFSDKITLQLPFIRIFQEKNNPFFVENLFNSV